MVMEESPSPDSVGREFVRQYYTLLNKAPIHLHRFYNNSSSFIHGGLDADERDAEPVVGQKEIHNRIQQLNFVDCHAKISQVDSQATLGNGVVVQVTGELSNGGQPMRRFTQTFVLASQSPRQYYVHNDIFRYQDFVFADDDADWGANPYQRPVADDPPPLPQPPQVAPPQQALPTPYFPPPPHPPSSVVNGHPPDDDFRQPAKSDSSHDDFEPDAAPHEDFEADASDAPDPPTEPPPRQTEPKTYANLVKSGHYSAGSVARTNAPAPALRSDVTAPVQSPAPIVSQHRPRPNRVPRADSANDTPAVPNSGGNPAAPTSGPGRRYSDSQQLFLGNLPHSATKDQLRALFERFGAIVDLRVYNKQTTGPVGPNGNANAPGKLLPNYAFLTFEDAESAQKCLNAGQLFYPSRDSSDAVVLNVQEKKSRPVTGGGPGMGGGGGRGGGPIGGGGIRVPRAPGFNRRPYQPRR